MNSELSMITVVPGKFVLGSSSPYDRDSPAVQVEITRPFGLMRHLVTQELYADVMGCEPWMAPRIQRVGGMRTGPNYPAVGITWQDAKDFAAALSKRGHRKFKLPTEAQWEYALKAGSNTLYHWGNDDSFGEEYAWFCPAGLSGADVERVHLREVGLLKPNAWGFFDMAGNVSEWVLDRIDFDEEGYRDPLHYPKEAVDFFCEHGEFGIQKNGYFQCGVACTESHYKIFALPGESSYGVGFRVAEELQ